VRILTVIGTRPQIIKYAAVSAALRRHFDEVLVDTGQHYDPGLSSNLYAELGVPGPAHNLGARHPRVVPQMAEVMQGLDAVVERDRPQALVCFGDTNSTLAAAVTALKHGLPIAHVESGERNFTPSGGRVHPSAIPEEGNRVMVDQISTLLLCVSARAVATLAEERVAGRVVHTGDIMLDLHRERIGAVAGDTSALERLGVGPREYCFCTVHRAVNTDSRARLGAIADGLLAADVPIVFPVHPRTRKMLDAYGLTERLARSGRVMLVDPVGYAESLALNYHSRAVITDSGGVLREAYFNGVMSVYVDETTEWIDIMDAGWSTFADADAGRIAEGLRAPPPASRPDIFGRGDAVRRTTDALVECFS
jgi:UDP-N-acetylglucosamine 2-epimerase